MIIFSEIYLMHDKQIRLVCKLQYNLSETNEKTINLNEFNENEKKIRSNKLQKIIIGIK